jgi:hypothetical protein
MLALPTIEILMDQVASATAQSRCNYLKITFIQNGKIRVHIKIIFLFET